MKKQIRSPKGSRLAIDKWSKATYPLPEIPKYAFSRHLRRREKYRYKDGTGLIDLANEWYILCYPTGRRLLTVLPF